MPGGRLTDHRINIARGRWGDHAATRNGSGDGIAGAASPSRQDSDMPDVHRVRRGRSPRHPERRWTQRRKTTRPQSVWSSPVEQSATTLEAPALRGMKKSSEDEFHKDSSLPFFTRSTFWGVGLSHSHWSLAQWRCGSACAGAVEGKGWWWVAGGGRHDLEVVDPSFGDLLDAADLVRATRVR